MKKSISGVAGLWLVVTVLAVGLLLGSSTLWAQQKTSALAQQLRGTWTLVSAVNEQEGKKTDVFGPNPRGTLILTPEGRYAMIMVRAGLPKFATNNRAKGTAEENQAVVQGSFAGFGRYTVESEKEQTVTAILHLEGSTFPNWEGQDQKRFMTVVGDELRLTTPAAAIGGTNHLVWKRAQ
jgi:hypothetical protein